MDSRDENKREREREREREPPNGMEPRETEPRRTAEQPRTLKKRAPRSHGASRRDYRVSN